MSEESQILHVQKLLERFKAGDSKALDELIALTYARLERMAHLMLRGYPVMRRWEQTGDLLDGAWIRLQRAMSAVKPETAKDYFGLAALQMRRELGDLARRYNGPQGLNANHESHNPVAGVTPVEAAADATHDPARLAEWSDLHEKVGELADEIRVVFELLYYEELTQAEAAEILGISVSTVKRCWQKARLALFDALGGHLPGTE